MASDSTSNSVDSSHVPLSEIGHFLHHRMHMTFTVNDLVGSDPSVAAAQTDPNLVNPWGLSESPTSPFWISDNNSGFASIYSVTSSGVKVNAIPPITIAVPHGQTPGSATPTGQVFNSFASDGAFTLSDGLPATFLFATEDGTISGWNAKAGMQSIIAVDEANNPADGDEAKGVGAVYKGLAIGKGDDGPVLFAANFRHGTVDTYDQKFNLIHSFTDPNLPKGFAPFNVQVLDGKLFVTFAEQNAAKHDDVAGAGNGFVDEFNLNGTLIQRVASNGPLELAVGIGDRARELRQARRRSVGWKFWGRHDQRLQPQHRQVPGRAEGAGRQADRDRRSVGDQPGKWQFGWECQFPLLHCGCQRRGSWAVWQYHVAYGVILNISVSARDTRHFG